MSQLYRQSGEAGRWESLNRAGGTGEGKTGICGKLGWRGWQHSEPLFWEVE